MRFTHNLSQMLEEISRKDEGWKGKCLQVFLYQTLADRLWLPFKLVCFNPFIALIVFVVLYLVFCIIYTPLWIVGLVFTKYGAYVALLLFINYLANLISRSIAFAGGNATVQKQMSSDFFRRLAHFLEALSVSIAEFSSTLLLGASGRIPVTDMLGLDAQLEDIVSKAPSLTPLVQFFRESVVFLEGRKMVTPDEYRVMTQLCDAIDEQLRSLAEMVLPARSYINEFQKKVMRGRGGARWDALQTPTDPLVRGNPALFKAVSHCLKVSKVFKAAVEASRPVSTQDDDGNILGKIKSFLAFSKGVEGCEKLTFPYMRCLLKHKFNAERFSLLGSDGNEIDAVVFPAAALQRGGRSADADSSEMSAKGLVLFCSPNAGFYEGVSQCDINGSWVGFYLKQGFDVCMFNYRGYGLSTGTPTPDAVKHDACQLYLHLQQTRAPARIIVHGESIGGMIACHLARSYPVDALVCDRTFASLDATAARLLGPWAGYGLKYCTLWNTNVAADYLACTCPKVILQDPDDEIIANLASLKNGVAMRIVLGDTSWKLISEPWEYSYAMYLGEDMPNRDKEGELIAQANDMSLPLSEAFVVHFYMCIALIGKRATLAKSPKKRRRQAESPQVHTARRPTGAASESLPLPTHAEAADYASSNDNEEESDASSPGNGLVAEMIGFHQSDPADEEGSAPPVSRRQQLETFCDVSLRKDSAGMSSLGMAPETKAWTAIARINGGSGHMLGQALGGGIEGVRAWICALLVWANNAAVDSAIPRGCTLLPEALKDLDALVEQLGEEGGSLTFARDALGSLLKRQQTQHFSKPPLSARRGAASFQSESEGSNNIPLGRDASDRIMATQVRTYTGSPALDAVLAKLVQCARSWMCSASTLPLHLCAECRENSAYIGTRQSFTGVDAPYVGRVIALHSGHNGWPAEPEIASVLDFFSNSGVF
mmetsp:Transcript_29154/g.64737  ORF Transcript_29154/g.64737 Transcript_29154/m.64737 type:complete len:940 (+) Transcript_29154:72-2891(+)